MRFGVREICNVVFRAKSKMTLGNRTFYKNEPVIYFDTLRTTTLEGASTTVYAQGGRGYSRLIAWEGERTLTFTMEDALLTPESFSILSGAGLIDASANTPMYVHMTSQIEVKADNTIVLPELACWNKEITSSAGKEYVNSSADIFVMVLDDNGEVDAEPCIPVSVTHASPEAGETTLTCYSHKGTLPKDSVVLVDYYVLRTAGAQQIEITPDSFSGNFYIEASTLFRRESDGVDMPAEFIIPNGKVQSSFTFTMAATGDPSTFTFTVDAFPDYTKFDKTKRVLAAIQVISDEDEAEDETREPCTQGFKTASYEDTGLSITTGGTDKNIELTVAGTVTAGGKNYDTVTFGTLPEDAVEVDLTLPVEEGKTYTITQNNPGFAVLYPDEFPDDTKTKDYEGSIFYDEPYQVVLAETYTPVKITVAEKDVAEPKFTITINHTVTFTE